MKLAHGHITYGGNSMTTKGGSTGSRVRACVVVEGIPRQT